MKVCSSHFAAEDAMRPTMVRSIGFTDKTHRMVIDCEMFVYAPMRVKIVLSRSALRRMSSSIVACGRPKSSRSTRPS
jgi:hypothetical protein